MKKCILCSAELPDETQLCANCGTLQSSAERGEVGDVVSIRNQGLVNITFGRAHATQATARDNRATTGATRQLKIAIFITSFVALVGMAVGLLRGPDRLAEVSLALTAIPLAGIFLLPGKRVKP